MNIYLAFEGTPDLQLGGIVIKLLAPVSSESP